jgi:serine/threonine protein kinase
VPAVIGMDPVVPAAMNLFVGEEGHFVWAAGCVFDRCSDFPSGRYLGSSIIGRGTYGKVIGCIDKKYNAQVAIKIVRSSIEYKAAAIREIYILNDLNGAHNTPKLLRDFEQDNHVCMVFDLYGDNLKKVIERWCVTPRLHFLKNFDEIFAQEV